MGALRVPARIRDPGGPGGRLPPLNETSNIRRPTTFGHRRDAGNEFAADDHTGHMRHSGAYLLLISDTESDNEWRCRSGAEASRQPTDRFRFQWITGTRRQRSIGSPEAASSRSRAKLLATFGGMSGMALSPAADTRRRSATLGRVSTIPSTPRRTDSANSAGQTEIGHRLRIDQQNEWDIRQPAGRSSPSSAHT